MIIPVGGCLCFISFTNVYTIDQEPPLHYSILSGHNMHWWTRYMYLTASSGYAVICAYLVFQAHSVKSDFSSVIVIVK